ncbi:MAG: hypothetical protein OXU20_07540 [Myxococcales bacterium]|nr:hypothetical protein [Myxococcales bacterium]MDD9966517.1 hypothetical protein [Myxococcales bacterium]
MKARLIRTEGPGLEATIECREETLHVMDEFSWHADSAPQPGQEFHVELSAGLLSDEDSWETIFAGNPERRVGLEHRQGWSYRAYGRVAGINPVRVDCGVLVVEDVVRTSDERVVGEYVAFDIDRLDAQGWRD